MLTPHIKYPFEFPLRDIEFIYNCRHVLKVIFNQNAYYTFKDNTLDLTLNRGIPCPYHDNHIIGVLVVSEDNKEYLQYVFPNINIARVHNSVSPSLFKYEMTNKKKVISFMPRKNIDDALQVINILKYRGVLNNWEIVPIDKKTEREVAQILSESTIYMSFGYPEGCPLPPQEAMASGCIVIGYHGMGGREYFKEEFSYPILHGDIINFAKTIERVIAIYETDNPSIIEKINKASSFIKEQYSPFIEENDVISFWSNILTDL